MDNIWSLKEADGGKVGSVEADSEKTSYPVPVTRDSHMDESWREAGFSLSTIRHPFQFTSTALAPVAPVSSTSPTSSTQPPSMDTSSSPPTQSVSTSGNVQHRHHPRRQSLSFFYPSRSLNPTPVSFSRRTGEESSFIQSTLIPLACFVPVPPLLSLLYLILGHTVLSFHTVLLVNSLKAGIVGGTILALPLTIILYLVFFPSSTPPTDSNPLDFFDDDESRHERLGPLLFSFCQSQTLLWRFVLQGLIMVFIGAAAGPLGVTVLSDAAEPQQYLTPGQAAKAGVVGGLILSPAIVGLSVVGLLVWRGQWPGRGVEETGDAPSTAS
ncbi:hypothetical protein L218DRAFT_955524 [Marasmius fiardii PR-910]|nr:hypothetical protein L218DRAFT_955524 [Marasmius fiardii PR-910]